jgi:uncharacterized protein (TIGR03437 family)
MKTFPQRLPLFQAVLLTLAMAGSATAQTAANAFFDDSHVQILNVTMAASDWAALQQNYLLDTYYHATLTWNGQSVTMGVRSHGEGSRSPIKPNLDFNFAHYTKTQTFQGLGFVILKANNEDASTLHEWLSMKLYRAMGLPAPREAPAQIYLNGQLLGFYEIVEHVDDNAGNYLERNFGENGGYLYEWQFGQQYEWGNLGTDPNAYAPFLELKSNQTSPDLKTFESFIQAVNSPALFESLYIAGLSPYIDPKLFLTYAATENVLADIDGAVGGNEGVNNFYLYQFQNSTLYQMIAWDKDRTFSDPMRDILYGVIHGPTINVLAQALYGYPDYRAVYLSEVTRAANLLGGAGGWGDDEVTREWAIVSAAALNDPNKQCDYGAGELTPCGQEDTLAGVQFVHAFLEQRTPFVLGAALSAGYQPISTNPQIQTVSIYPPGYTVQQVSPGTLALIGGNNLGPQNLPATGTTTLPRELGSTFVAVDGVRAPLIGIGSTVGFQMPEDQPSNVAAHIVLSVNGAMSNVETVDVWPTSPAILAVARANGSVVGAGNAPKAGESITVYAIGLGAVTPDVPLGGSPASGSAASTVITPQITVGTTSLRVLFSGLAGGFPGLYQVNVQMPATLPTGSSTTLTLTDAGLAYAVQLALQ